MNTIGMIFVAVLILFLAFAGIAGALTHPLGAVAFVLFAAAIFGVAWLKKARF